MVALFIVIFIAGLSVLLYPIVSDYINSVRQAQVVREYFQAMENLTERDFTELFEAANEYNEKLRRTHNRFVMSEEEFAEYKNLLNPLGLDVLGTLEIGVIDIHLPIFHGTDEGVLQVALCHLEGTSLPVGGEGTHAAITGHRGLPSSTLLTNLDRMVIGDTFNIHVLNKTLTYRVDQIMIVLPHETEELAIIEDADMVTLITCTPYGINTHRILVRGQRTNVGEFGRPETLPSGARLLTESRFALLLIIPFAIIVTLILFIRLRRIYGRGKK